MQPSNLKSEQFAGYPPEARKLAVSYLSVLRQLPLSFVPSLLREVIEYDFKFPAERTAIDKELANLGSLSPAQLDEWFQAFSQFSLPARLEQFNWINQPAQFVEQLSAYLWSAHRLDAFRAAATEYGNRLRAAVAPEPLVAARLGIAIIGQGVSAYDAPLFRNLREHGTYFVGIKPENGLELLLSTAQARARKNPIPYGHWYIDGGKAYDHDPLLTCLSYQALEPLRVALLKDIQGEVSRPGMGPEELRTNLARLSPVNLGMDKSGDAVLERFQLKLFTEGSGTQIFSTTFAQWSAREVLRRAQPLTLFVRYAPRQKQRPMEELLSGNQAKTELDPVGSLIDGDMGAYYQWINLQRLPGAEHSSFLVWFEGHNLALAIGPTLPRGVQSTSEMNLQQLVSLATG